MKIFIVATTNSACRGEDAHEWLRSKVRGMNDTAWHLFTETSTKWEVDCELGDGTMRGIMHWWWDWIRMAYFRLFFCLLGLVLIAIWL